MRRSLAAPMTTELGLRASNGRNGCRQAGGCIQPHHCMLMICSASRGSWLAAAAVARRGGGSRLTVGNWHRYETSGSQLGIAASRWYTFTTLVE